MLKIVKTIASLLGMIIQTLLRMGITRGESNNMSDAMRSVEDAIDDNEEKKEIKDYEI